MSLQGLPGGEIGSLGNLLFMDIEYPKKTVAAAAVDVYEMSLAIWEPAAFVAPLSSPLLQ